MSGLLSVRDLVVTYGHLRAVDGLSLEVGAGETVGVLGPNGAGKSTLLAALMGARSIRSGSIVVDGVDLTRRSPTKVAAAGLAIVPEGRRIFPSLTIAQNLALGAWVRKPGAAGTTASTEEVCERFPILASRLNSLAATLSGGEAQMLSIGMALMSRPRLLLLDEPSFGLAPVIVDAVYEHLRSLRDDGMAVLVVEQDTSRIASIVDRVYLCRQGRVMAAGGPELAADTALIADTYLGHST